MSQTLATLLAWFIANVLPLLLLAAIGYLAWRLMRRTRNNTTTVPEAATQPALHLRTRSDDVHVLPDVIRFPSSGKLRLGYHPPFMDRHVGRADFTRLPFVDVRGDGPATRELSRHAACIWREANGECFVQIGWPGPGEVIRARNQTRVLRFGRAHDAASQPFRFAHRDVLRLSATVEYVFLEVEPVRDRPTPEQKKIEAFESSGMAPSSNTKLSLLRPERRGVPARPPIDDDDDLA